jgi:hypothetical protein
MSRCYRLSMVSLVLLLAGVCGQSSPLEAQVSGDAKQSEVLQARFTQAGNGVITDHVTGLEWYVSPTLDNTWHQAKVWTENLAAAGGGWRLPDMPELKALYQTGPSRIHMDPLFQLPGAWVWSGQMKDPSFAWGFAFYSGLEGWHSVDYGYGRGVLAVRSRK